MGMVGLEVRAVEVDTDALGTFTAEVPRLRSMREAAIAKARLAMEATDCTLGLGSEGTIGADPQMPLLNSDRELIVLVDQQSGAITSQSIRSFDITVATTLMKSGHGLEPFLRQADFPRHRLIVRPDGIEPADLPPVLLRKAVADPVTLIDAITACARASPTGRARVESDLRAHCSPSRQAVIAKVAWSLSVLESGIPVHALESRVPVGGVASHGQVAVGGRITASADTSSGCDPSAGC